MKIIPLKQHPNIEFDIFLNQQACSLHIYYTGMRTFIDISLNSTLIQAGKICNDKVPLVKDDIGFLGNLYFFDLKGNEFPVWTNYGDRFILLYLTESEPIPNTLKIYG